MNFRRRPFLCTTLYRNPMQVSNFGGTFDQLFLWSFYEIFTEDASLLFLYHGAKKWKMTKNSNRGGPALRWLRRNAQRSEQSCQNGEGLPVPDSYIQPVQLSTPNFWAAVTTVVHSTVVHSTERHVEAGWKKISHAFTVHSTDSASQLMGPRCSCTGCSHAFHVDERLRPAEIMRALLNTEQRCVQGCWKLHETGCVHTSVHVRGSRSYHAERSPNQPVYIDVAQERSQVFWT